MSVGFRRHHRGWLSIQLPAPEAANHRPAASRAGAGASPGPLAAGRTEGPGSLIAGCPVQVSGRGHVHAGEEGQYLADGPFPGGGLW